MTPNRVKLGRAVTVMKYLASIVSLIFLAKTLIWSKITFPALNSLNLAERGVSTKKLPIFLFQYDLALLNVNFQEFITKELDQFSL